MIQRRALLPLLFLASLAAGQAPPEPTGPETDRVGLPDYAGRFVHLRTTSIEGGTQMLEVFANDAAASVSDAGQLPYPYGSIFVVEWRRAVPDGEGRLRGGELFQIDVMRREPGYGAAYGAARTGEWEYVRYRPDGSHLIPPHQSGVCAACHQGAGAARDFVFGGRFAGERARDAS